MVSRFATTTPVFASLFAACEIIFYEDPVTDALKLASDSRECISTLPGGSLYTKTMRGRKSLQPARPGPEACWRRVPAIIAFTNRFEKGAMIVNKLRWGVLGTANIAATKVIPAMQRGEACEVAAIASRDLERARQVARHLGIPKAYGSYEELLADDSIEVVYNPLPNHLHRPWS